MPPLIPMRLGPCCTRCLVGDPPYPGSTAQAVLGKIIAGKPVSASEQRPSIPANVDAAVRKALEKLPADRFASAQDFVKALADSGFRYGDEAAASAERSAGPWRGLSVAFGALALVLTLAPRMVAPPASAARSAHAVQLGAPTGGRTRRRFGSAAGGVVAGRRKFVVCRPGRSGGTVGCGSGSVMSFAGRSCFGSEGAASPFLFPPTEAGFGFRARGTMA